MSFITDLLQYPNYITAGAVAVSLVWTLILSVLHFRMQKHYRELIKISSKKDLTAILKDLLVNVKATRKQVEIVEEKTQNLKLEAKLHIKHVLFQRFNPFQETGGNQSFILALLDEHQNGLLLTSLHSRDLTRVYAKKLDKGVPTDGELSEEEKQLLHK
jgi:hypothetical protein